VLVLQDPLRLREDPLMVPGPIAQILGLLDGTRSLNAVRAGFELRTGVSLLPSQLESFVGSLDEALLLDNQRFRGAKDEALMSYRSGPFRAPALAGSGYPLGDTELSTALDEYCRNAAVDGTVPGEPIVGLISPHIDFARGWETYARTWVQAREAVQEADLIILLGTDHGGSPGALTFTRQNYATPWGVLPTDIPLVDRLTDILGKERAFAEEVHHIGEHSIELAAVWLHYIAGGKPKRLLPILCGQHGALLGQEDGETGGLEEVLSFLAEVATGPRTLTVAAGDVSHVGPVFGDSLPLSLSSKAAIRAADEQWLQLACSGNSGLLVEHMRMHGDPTRICGAAPIHYMLTLLEGAKGRVVAYDQCPADDEFGSLVSVAGVLFTV